MATPTGARVSTVKNGNLDDMNIAIGSDHRGAKFARLLTYNVLMPNHYTAQSEYFDANAEPVAGAFMIENAAPRSRRRRNSFMKVRSIIPTSPPQSPRRSRKGARIAGF